MMIHLTQLWNGEPAPEGHGGRAALNFDTGLLALSWDVTLPGEPRLPEAPVGCTDGLWEHDVIELFLSSRKDPGRYLELEFGPGGHWLGLSFSGVRERKAVLDQLDPELRHELQPGRWRGRAALPTALVEKHAGPAPWNGLVALVTGEQRVPACWPKLPGDAPDFHQPESWAPIIPSPSYGGASG